MSSRGGSGILALLVLSVTINYIDRGALSVAAPGRAPYVPPRKVLRVDSKGQATYVLVESERERERERQKREEEGDG